MPPKAALLVSVTASVMLFVAAFVALQPPSPPSMPQFSILNAGRRFFRLPLSAQIVDSQSFLRVRIDITDLDQYSCIVRELD